MSLCPAILLLSVAFATLGVDEPPSEAGDASLARLMAAYTSVQTAAVDLRAKAQAPGTQDRLVRMTTARDRRFAYEDFIATKASEPGNWMASPNYFVFFDGQTMCVARPLGHIYTKHVTDAEYTAGFGPVQLGFAPWPCVTTWAHDILESHDRLYEKSDRSWKASSTKVGVSLAWTEDMQLLEVSKPLGNAGGSHSLQFADFMPGDGVPLPRSATELTHLSRAGVWTDTQSVYSISNLVLNPADAEARLAFDPAKRSLSRLDESTQDVVDPQGKVLFNMKKLEADADRALNGRGERHIWLYAGSAATVVVLVLLALRVLKRR